MEMWKRYGEREQVQLCVTEGDSLTFIWRGGASLVRRLHPHLLFFFSLLSSRLATQGFILAKGQTNAREGRLNIHLAAGHREAAASFNTARIVKARLLRR